MDFKMMRVPYAGRERFPSNGNGKAIANSLIKQYLGGGVYGGGGDGSYGGDENRGGNSTAFYAYLSKNSDVISALDLAGGTVHNSIVVHGYRNMEDAQTLIGDIAESAQSETYHIVGLPESGMSVEVLNQGTTATTLNISIDNSISEDSGTLRIPVAVNINDNPLDPYHYVWYENANKVMTITLTWSWTINRAGESSYVLDLSNETAGVNCDSAGTIYSASTAALTCTASTHIGTEEVNGVTYSIYTQPRFNAHGVAITTSANKGILSWQSNFGFDGPSLPIEVNASVSGSIIATKTMTINKNYPGADGSPAVTRWIVTSTDQVKYNPNTSACTPSVITAQVMMQVGGNEPYVDTATTIYYANGILPSDPAWTQDYALPSTGVTVNPDDGFICFVLKSSAGVYYEIETVPILWDGVDGTNGTNGENGENGKSAWYMTMSNDNASINCNAGGTILTGATRPQTSQVKLYYGDERRTDATYVVSANTPYTGVTTATSQGILSISFGNSFNFNTDILELAVSGSASGEVRDVKIMSITKSYAGGDGNTPYIGTNGNWWIGDTDTGISAEGEPGDNGDTPYIGSNGNWWIGNTDTGVKAEGQDAVSYWIEPNFTEIIFDRNTSGMSPTAITATAKKQVGQAAPTAANDATIMYCWVNRSTGIEGNKRTMGSAITISVLDCINYSRLRLYLYRNNDSAQLDMEDIDILMDGLNGTSGQGRAGAAIRGPYDYYAYTATTVPTRLWCDGQPNDMYPAAEQWIDVVYKDGVYYYCSKAYVGRLSTSYLASNFTSGQSFDFIATNLLMASGASINFLTGNEIYLRNSANTITAGISSGPVYNFWAGDTSPDNAPFKVDVNGGMSATTGFIGGWEYTSSGLNWDYDDGFETYQHASFNGLGTSVSFRTAGNSGNYYAGIDGISFNTEESNAVGLHIGGAGNPDVEFNGDGSFTCDMTMKRSDGDAVKVDGGIRTNGLVKTENFHTAVSSLYNSNVKIAMVTTGSSASTSTASTSNAYWKAVWTGGTTYKYGYWTFNGDMKVCDWAENGSYSLYMIVGTQSMVNDEIVITEYTDAVDEYRPSGWRSGGASYNYVVDVIKSGSTYYRCTTGYIGWLNFGSNTAKWASGSWDTIRTGRFYEGDPIEGYPEGHSYGIPYRWVGMWLGSSSSSGSKTTYGYVPTGIFCKSALTNRRGDTIYIEV